MSLEKIRDLYCCSEIVQTEQQFPLQKWFNEVIEKKYDELDLCDVLRMLRQNLFLELAIKKAIDFLLDDPFVGELYDGQLFETLSETECDFDTENVVRLKEIIAKAKCLTNCHYWTYETESAEFLQIVSEMSKRIQ